MSGWFDDEGRYHLRGELDADHGRIVDAALSEARDALFRAGHGDVSWVDAVVEIAQRSLDGVAGVGRRERFRVNWFIDPTDPVPARWGDGLPVPGWLQAMLSCDSTVAPVFTDGALPVSVGRTRRSVPDRTRRIGVAPRPQVSGPVVHADPLAAGPPRRPRRTRRGDRHRQPGRPLPGRPPTASPRPARHQRRRRPSRRVDVHRRTRPPHRSSDPADQTDRPATRTGHALRTSPRRTAPALVGVLPRPTRPPRRRLTRRGRRRTVPCRRFARRGNMRAALGIAFLTALVMVACTDEDDASTDDTVGTTIVPATSATAPEESAETTVLVEHDAGRDDRRHDRPRRCVVRSDDPPDDRRRAAHHRRVDRRRRLRAGLRQRPGPRLHARRPGAQGAGTPCRGVRTRRRQRQRRERLRLAGDRHRRHRPRRLAHRRAGGRRRLRGLRRRVEPAARRRRRRRAVAAGAPARHGCSPITADDLYAYARSITLLASGGPADRLHRLGPATRRRPDGDGHRRPACSMPEATGSNAWAVGADLVTGGEGGLLVANPHFPWEGELRFWEVHLTVPGEVDIYGSQPRRPARRRHRVHRAVRLVPHGLGRQPVHRLHARRSTRTTRRRYLVDGEPRPMTATDHEVEVLQPDGSTTVERPHDVGQRVRTDHRLPRTRLDGDDHAHLPRRQHRQRRVRRAVHGDDGGADASTSSSPPTGTTRASRCSTPSPSSADGRAWYADTSATPNLSAEAEALYTERLATDPITGIAGDNGVVLLDGSDSTFEWEEVQRRPRPRARPVRRDADGRARRLRVQRQRQLLDAARHRDARRRLLAAARHAGDGAVVAHP